MATVQQQSDPAGNGAMMTMLMGWVGQWEEGCNEEGGDDDEEGVAMTTAMMKDNKRTQQWWGKGE
jgi:hypothetical protein